MKPYALAAGALALSMLQASALAAGTMHVALQIRPGLWEYSDTPKVTGDTILPDVLLERIPAAQRAQFTAETRKQMAAPSKARECMTQAKFEQRVSFSVSSCTQKIVSNTPVALEIDKACRSESKDMKQETVQKIVASSPTMVTLTAHAVTKRGGKTMTLDSKGMGRWLSADCGSLKNGVIQQRP